MSANETNLPTAGTPSKPKAGKVPGLDVPFPESAELPEGVDPDTRLFHGIHPDNGERLTVTLEGLKAEFGDELGEKKYLAIAGIGGGSVFFNTKSEATTYRPPLGVGGIVNPEHQKQVADILSAKE
jgi:hypothetical protein